MVENFIPRARCWIQDCPYWALCKGMCQRHYWRHMSNRRRGVVWPPDGYSAAGERPLRQKIVRPKKMVDTAIKSR